MYALQPIVKDDGEEREDVMMISQDFTSNFIVAFCCWCTSFPAVATAYMKAVECK